MKKRQIHRDKEIVRIVGLVSLPAKPQHSDLSRKVGLLHTAADGLGRVVTNR